MQTVHSEIPGAASSSAASATAPAPTARPAPASAPTPGGSSTDTLLIATGNQGKARELAQLLADVPCRLLSLRDVGIDADVEEVGATLEENAAIKARAYAGMSGLWTMADDSGLEVDALDGAPGPLSKRFAGEGASDQDLVEYLLRKLEGVPWEQRAARFRCVIALTAPQTDVRLYHGQCPGIIALGPKGAGGFGYDPVFFLPDAGLTMAELSMEEKNQLSHRARAARALAEALKQEP